MDGCGQRPMSRRPWRKRRSHSFCVGTPSAANGSLSTVYLNGWRRRSASLARRSPAGTRVVFRSTMLPGTCADHAAAHSRKASGKAAGVDFGVAVNPEFLREGSSVRDFFDPPKTVIGETDAAEPGTPLRPLPGAAR